MEMSRRCFLLNALLVTVAAATLGLGVACGTKAKEGMLNVVILYVDDMGWAGVGCYGCDFIDTPEIDRLAADGIRFTNAYSAAPNCSPSRASLLTGLYPPRHGITQWLPGTMDEFTKRPLIQPDLPQILDMKFTTLAEVFKSRGYATAIMGKWHLGDDSPTSHGFDLHLGNERYKRITPPELREENAPENRTIEQITQFLQRNALAFIDRNADKPFFLYIPFHALHKPWRSTSGLELKYVLRHSYDKDRVMYSAMTEGVDQFVGALRAKLNEKGIEKNTVIVFSSDNGGAYGPSLKDLRERKGYLYEGGIRVPCIIAGGGIQGGRVCDTPVIQVDLMPTLLSMAGFKPLKTDGVNLQPILAGTGDIAPRDLFWHYPHYSYSGGRPASAIRSGDYKLIHWYEDDSWELYDLKSDLAEKNDISAGHPERTMEMRRKLENWLQETGAALPRRR